MNYLCISPDLEIFTYLINKIITWFTIIIACDVSSLSWVA